MDIIFMGTPIFAVPSLKELIFNDTINVRAVVTQPDRKKGRGQQLTPSPVKRTAEKFDIPVLQSENINNESFIRKLNSYKLDFIVVVAFGQKLSKTILNIPKYGCINLHASLLPKYRGASPIHQAVINGDKKTGNTTMYMGEGLDDGDIIYQQEMEIKNTDTVGTVHDKLAVKGAKLIIKTLNDIKSGAAPRIKQDDSKATYVHKIDKDIGEINWEDDATEIFNLVRGVNPWPGAYTYLDGDRLKIWKVEVIDEEKEAEEYESGTIVTADQSEGLIVQCGSGLINIKKLQLPGRKKMQTEDFLCGHDLKIVQKLGKK
ncbi:MULTISPECIES: methionyl-tRNA formyltransferase [unclassified Halanaerobium]|uniref:methionyl-tRNA formyltransferase n=1 Tax=unclassified Halanaerobium TaxID=2641197 RepID=UPI000DF14581|nr:MULTISPECIES: methionyl-tRNA formyltransferase [unclassified Halanaerobium]RCW51412.1 methionyl-tRNA formyltransferase [Halanaerobium sp. MA284_MarDTE_T2]RCW89201.1 methionyl-tRNA formyltransferase [Halanaerobium sp. DL-01]